MTEKASKINNAALSWIWDGMQGSRIRVLFLVIAGIVSAACSLLEAVALKDLINGAAARSSKDFWTWAGVLAGLIIIQIAIRAFTRYLSELTRASLENGFKGKLFRTLLKKDYSSVTALHSGEWMNRLTNDAVLVAKDITDIIPEALSAMVRLLGAVILIMYYVKSVSWLVFPVAAALVVLMLFLRKRLKSMHKKIQEADGRVRVFMSDHLSNLTVVRSFAKEDQSASQADERMDDHLKARMERNRFSNICNTGISILLRGVYAAAVIYCGYGILSGTMDYGIFAAVIKLVGQVQAPFVNISGYIPRWYAMIASAERLMEAEAFEDDSPEGKKSPEEVRAFYENDFTGIELKNVSFTYEQPIEWQEGSFPDEDGSSASARSVVISGLDLKVRKGDVIAVTGPSGCGKSTLLKILMSFYQLDGGEKLLCTQEGNVDLDARWRGLFAYVPQGNQLMSGSIRDILTFGDRSVAEDKVVRALGVSCASEFIRELPEGLDTELGERGAGLSEGQMQRLAIARAIVSGHPILLLDEATSSLDEATEQALLENLRTLTDRTVVIVTHRRRVLSICDREVKMG